MVSKKSEQIARWLRRYRYASEVSGVDVTIGKQTYHGARYRRGNGELQLYLVGKLPPSYRRSSRTVYRFSGHNRDWFVCGYCEGGTPLDKYQEKHHPFGNSFTLCQWMANEPIDYYDYKPYRRMTATIGD